MKEELRKQNYIKPKLDVIPVYENQVLGMNSSVTDRVVNNPQLSRDVEMMEDEEAMLYVAAAELIPEAGKSDGRLAGLSFGAGFLVMMILDVTMG